MNAAFQLSSLSHFSQQSVEWLLSKKVDINEKAKDGTTAAMHACKESGNVQLLQVPLVDWYTGDKRQQQKQQQQQQQQQQR